MARLFWALLICFCCIPHALATGSVPPKKGSPVAEVITFLDENAINNSQQVIDYVETNNLLNAEYSNSAKVSILSYYAKAYQYLGEREQALQILARAFDIISTHNVSTDAHAAALDVRAAVYAEMTKYASAIADQKAIIQLYPQYTNNKNIGAAYTNLADTYLTTTDFKNAFDSLYKAQFVFKAIKDQAMLAFTYSRLGMIYRTIGDFDKALDNMLQALKQMEGVAYERRLAVTYNNTAIIYKDLGRYDEAINFHKRSLNLKQKIGYQRGMVYSYNNLGETYRLKGDFAEAQRFLDKAQMLATQLNNTMLLGSTYLYRARIAKQQNRLDDAIEHLNNAMSIYQKRNSKSRMAEADVEYGDVYFKLGKFKQSQQFYQAALELSKEVQKNVVTFTAFEGLVKVYEEQGLYKQALEALIEYQTLKAALFDKQSQQRLESLIVENQLFSAQQQLKLAQQESKIKQAELERVETKRNWLALLLFSAFIISWLIYRKVQQHNRIKLEIKTRKEIELSQRRLNLALWGSGDTLWDWDLKNGEIKRENLPSYSRFSEAASGLDVDSLKEFVHPDDYDLLNNALNAHIDGKTPFFEASYRVLNNQGEWCWLLDRGKVVEFDDDTGRAVRITGTQRDITTLKQQEVALKELNNELEQRVLERTTELATMNQQLIHTIEKLEVAQEYIIEAEKHAALGSMVAGLAHEINTPLGTAITAVSHLKMQTISTESQFKSKTLSSQGFESFLSDVNNSSQLIESGVGKAGELVARFKLLAGKNSEQQPKDISINDFLNESFKMAVNALQLNNDKASLTLEGNATLHSYPATLAQVFNILIENSLVHADVPFIEVCCDIKQQNQQVELNFFDNGNYISSGDEKRIFEPFYTTKRNKGHSGLGLHIAYNNITQDLKGSIECYKHQQGGLAFLVKLPNI